MKSIVLAGQKTKVYCETCQAFVQATYAYGPFKFDNGVVANNVMRATCDQCQAVVAVAHQSAPVLKESLEASTIRSTMRLPQELLDFIGLQLNRVGTQATRYDIFLRALLMACHGKEGQIGLKLSSLEDPVLKQPNNATLTLMLSSNLNRILASLGEASHISNTSELLRRLIVLTEEPELGKPVAAEVSRLVLAYT